MIVTQWNTLCGPTFGLSMTATAWQWSPRMSTSLDVSMAHVSHGECSWKTSISLLKFLHVAAVIVWVGGVVALTVLNARIGRLGDPAAQAAMGQQSEAFGRTVVGPAMAVTLLAGLWMAGQFGIPFTSLWIVWGLAGFIAFIALGVIAMGRPGAQLGVARANRGRRRSPVATLRQRLGLLGALTIVILASVVWAMVFKPTL